MQAPASEGCHTGAKSAGLRGVHRGGHGALSLKLTKEGGVKAGDTSFSAKGIPHWSIGSGEGTQGSHIDTSSVSPAVGYVIQAPPIA